MVLSMNEFNIYLSGALTGFTLEKQLKWRNEVIELIKSNTTRPVRFFNPPKHFSPSTNNHLTEREVMEFEVERLHKSDLVIVNLNYPKSIGTAMELAIAYDNKIPILGLHRCSDELHPWLGLSCNRIFKDKKELADYVITNYLYD